MSPGTLTGGLALGPGETLKNNTIVVVCVLAPKPENEVLSISYNQMCGGLSLSELSHVTRRRVATDVAGAWRLQIQAPADWRCAGD